MTRIRTRVALVVAVLLVAGGLASGLALATGGSGPAAPGTATGTPGYAYYQSMMHRFGGGPGTGMGGSMMGGSAGGTTSGSWWDGPDGYRWVVGGTGAPGWMRGGAVPSGMMGASHDPGTVMGELFADAPGPRVGAAESSRLGDEVPSGARVETAARRVVFTGRNVHLVVVASPSMPSENFRVAGMVDPTVVVPSGADVTIELVNADDDMAHGLVVTTAPSSSWMPMMTAAPAFPGAALWFLGASTAAGMHTGTLAFTAGAPGSYRYLCPVPGHAEEGMAGTFVVTA